MSRCCRPGPPTTSASPPSARWSTCRRTSSAPAASPPTAPPPVRWSTATPAPVACSPTRSCTRTPDPTSPSGWTRGPPSSAGPAGRCARSGTHREGPPAAGTSTTTSVPPSSTACASSVRASSAPTRASPARSRRWPRPPRHRATSAPLPSPIPTSTSSCTRSLILRRPEEAAHVLGKLLLAVGEGRILWGTDSVWYGPPQPLIDAFRPFTIPERLREAYGYPALTRDVKQKILGGNAAGLYGIEPPTRSPEQRAWIDEARRHLETRLP